MISGKMRFGARVKTLAGVVFSLVTYIVLIVEISAWSLTYKELRNKNLGTM